MAHAYRVQTRKHPQDKLQVWNTVTDGPYRPNDVEMPDEGGQKAPERVVVSFWERMCSPARPAWSRRKVAS